MADKRYRATYKEKGGTFIYLHFRAPDDEAAQKLAEEAQARRESRFPLTFARLEQAKETGSAGLLAISPKLAADPAAIAAWAEQEAEKRKRDQARYDAGFKLMKLEVEV